MSTLLCIAWIGAGTTAGAVTWWLALRFTQCSTLSLGGGKRWLLFGLMLTGAILGGLLVWRRVALSNGASILVITVLLSAISLVDWRTRRIPNALNLALLAWALVQIAWMGQPTITNAGIGLAVSGGLFLILAIIGRGAMGFGDVKLAGVLGALLGFPLVLRALVVGIFAGGAVALYLILSRRTKTPNTMAYGPYLALGGWVTALGILLKLWS
ncbi:MAG: prepilin peptidase [Anaerolineae bacterium]